jgi:chondroitin AC lyase
MDLALNSLSSSPVSLEIIKKRLRALLAPVMPKPALLAGRRLAESLSFDGSWADIDYYALPQAQGWPAAEHLARTFAFAQGREVSEGELTECLRLAFDFWLANDFTAVPDGWRWHSIETPRAVGEIALLFGPELSSGALGKTVEILTRNRWEYWSALDGGWREWSGANLTATAYNMALRACLEGMPLLLNDAFERVYRELHTVRSMGEEGIQSDMSFHFDGARLNSGGGGLDFTLSCARFLVLGHGTPWQAPPEIVQLFTAHLLDGQQWMICGDVFDPSAAGRDLPSASRSLQPLAAVVDRLAHLANTPRRPELVSLAQRLYGVAGPLEGHRHFWRSDLTVHHRPGYYASVRVRSTRGTEADARLVGEGVTHLRRTGAEYQGMSPVWDRLRLPGVTCEQTPDATLGPGSSFAGGVSEGDYGLTVMEVEGETLKAKKAWFFFDEAVVCLGTDIHGSRPRCPVYTTVNQCLLRGPARAVGDNKKTVDLHEGEHDLSGAYRVEHDGFVYYFPVPLPVVARLGAQTAPFPENSDAEPPSCETFNLWIDHGVRPYGANYAYTVLPVGLEPDSPARARSELSQIDIIANTPGLQAVAHRRLRMRQIVFWQPGEIPLGNGRRVAVNQPCILICREAPNGGVRLSMANPRNEALVVHVEYAGQCLCFTLPGGDQAGRSVSRLL